MHGYRPLGFSVLLASWKREGLLFSKRICNMRDTRLCLSTCQHYSNKKCPVSIAELNHSVCPMSSFILCTPDSSSHQMKVQKYLPWTGLIRSALERVLRWLSCHVMIPFLAMVGERVQFCAVFPRITDYRNSSLCHEIILNMSARVVFCCVLHSFSYCSDIGSDCFLNKLILNHNHNLN